MKLSFLIKISPGSLPRKGILNLENTITPTPKMIRNNPNTIRNFPKVLIIFRTTFPGLV